MWWWSITAWCNKKMIASLTVFDFCICQFHASEHVHFCAAVNKSMNRITLYTALIVQNCEYIVLHTYECMYTIHAQQRYISCLKHALLVRLSMLYCKSYFPDSCFAFSCNNPPWYFQPSSNATVKNIPDIFIILYLQGNKNMRVCLLHNKHFAVTDSSHCLEWPKSFCVIRPDSAYTCTHPHLSE